MYISIPSFTLISTSFNNLLIIDYYYPRKFRYRSPQRGYSRDALQYPQISKPQPKQYSPTTPNRLSFNNLEAPQIAINLPLNPTVSLTRVHVPPKIPLRYILHTKRHTNNCLLLFTTLFG